MLSHKYLFSDLVPRKDNIPLYLHFYFLYVVNGTIEIYQTISRPNMVKEKLNMIVNMHIILTYSKSGL